MHSESPHVGVSLSIFESISTVGRSVLSSLVGLSSLHVALAQVGITFEQRVAAQRAIEQVYWEHRIWPESNPEAKPQFDQIVDETQLRRRVETYLRNRSIRGVDGDAIDGRA